MIGNSGCGGDQTAALTFVSCQPCRREPALLHPVHLHRRTTLNTSEPLPQAEAADEKSVTSESREALSIRGSLRLAWRAEESPSSLHKCRKKATLSSKLNLGGSGSGDCRCGSKYQGAHSRLLRSVSQFPRSGTGGEVISQPADCDLSVPIPLHGTRRRAARSTGSAGGDGPSRGPGGNRGGARSAAHRGR